MSCPEEMPVSDAIGDTVFSKKWLIGSLLKTVKFIQNEPAAIDGEDPDDQLCIDDIETELSTIWDMSSNVHVQGVLLENSAHDIFMNATLKTISPRLAEISIGILANMIHNDTICKLVSADRDFCNGVISMLSTSDIPFLTQLVRFLNTITCKEGEIWCHIINQKSCTFFSSTQWILQNCLNVDLLKLSFKLINSILYCRKNLGGVWLDNDQDNDSVNVLCKACFHILDSTDTSHDHESTQDWTGISPDSVDFFYHFWFIIQSVYKVEFFHDKFQPCIPTLEELFSRFDNLLSKAPNSLLSYTAACTFFLSLFVCAERLLPQDPKWDCVRELKEKMRSEKWLTPTNRRAIQLCASTVDQLREELEEALCTLRQFERDLLESH